MGSTLLIASRPRDPAVAVVADDLAGRAEGGRHMGEHPVVVAALRAVQDVGEDLLAAADRIPEQLEDAPGHARVSDDAVRRAEQLALLELSDADEDLVGIGDLAAGVGLADDDFVLSERPFDAGERELVVAHSRPFLQKQIV